MSILWRVNVAVEMTQSHCNITVSMLKAWENRARPRVLETLKAADPLARSTRGEGSVKATQCTVEGCERTGKIRRGLCELHYDRLRRNGELEPLPTLTTTERLAAGLGRMPTGCLEWTGGTGTNGYGQIRVNGKKEATHRLAWTLVNGPIPEGLCVLHRCDNPPCAQTGPTEGYPEGHLFLGTKATNNADMAAKGRAWYDRNLNPR